MQTMTPTTPSLTLPPDELEFRTLALVACLIRRSPAGDHLVIMLRLLAAAEGGGANMSALGDCLIDAIAQRMREGEW